MTFQLLNIAVYNSNGEQRNIEFQPGRVNVITGASKTGKTALIDIVDYCLGRTDFTIPAGVIRDTVEWYAIRIESNSTQAVIARPKPAAGSKSNSEAYLSVGGSVPLPAYGDLKRTTNVNALERFLTEWIGVGPNESVPTNTYSRDRLQANISHAKFLLFQPQNRIADKSVLFYRQNEDFVPQAIKDTLPYFLGAVPDDYYERMQVLRRARRELKILERRLEDEESIQGRDNSRALSLLSEAVNVGIIDSAAAGPVVGEYETILDILKSCLAWKPSSTHFDNSNALEELRQAGEDILDRITSLKNEVDAARAFSLDQDSFSTEVSEQRNRLESIGLYRFEGEMQDSCPLCQQRLVTKTPTAANIQQSLRQLDSQMEAIMWQRPRLAEYVAERESSISQLTQSLHENRAAIESVLAQQAELRACFEIA